MNSKILALVFQTILIIYHIGFWPTLYIIIEYNKCQSGFQGSAYGDFDARAGI